DYGTANTFDVINEKSEFITGFITPGISSCAEALYQKAAQLPKIEIKAPKSIIAKNTVDSFQAGLGAWAYRADEIYHRAAEGKAESAEYEGHCDRRLGKGD
ncbi:MAG: type III pantothenate kinase, partial [Anaerotignum faecicola]